MDARTYNNVVLRFANGLAVNDPLQTLYQTMSGREPQAATCAADKKWGDWRTHLAMMLSNPSGNADLDRKSVITLGDSLANRGRLFASHFCYLTAQVKFSDYTDRSGAAKLVLLGSSHQLPFTQFATCRAIMLSLCYEYAMRLNKKDFVMPALQTYKYLLAVRLAECNRLAAALQHLEYLAIDLTNLPLADSRPLAIRVAELADALKMADPLCTDPDTDPDWLANLKQMLDDISETNLQTSNMSRAISTSTVSTSGADLNSNQGMEVPMYGDNTNLHGWGQQQQQPPMTYDQTDSNGMLNPNAVPMISNLQQPYQQSQFQTDYTSPPTYGIDQQSAAFLSNQISSSNHGSSQPPTPGRISSTCISRTSISSMACKISNNSTT
ncbi:protein transport protein Sec16B-like isoform X2 [Nilaparvata lugens]|uniref:protein transport protein Sec16B-like isoform X2 n=1 Tax=Nilaparvata lugens TaxID=108931 RepID=UPI00193E2589|nr:protein transport protein Sec16B-like isoform X2 [Nilaparvata lugens]